MGRKQEQGSTPALRIVGESGVDFQVVAYDADAHSAKGFALDAAAKLGCEAETIFKTLVAVVEGVHPDSRHPDVEAIAVVPANCTLNLKRLAGAAGGKRARMLERSKAQLLTGYVAGGISPLGTKTPLPVFIDERAIVLDTMIVSAGKRGVSISIAPEDLANLCQALFADIADPL